MTISLDKYKPGQLITSMTRRVFVDLWAEMLSGEARDRWPAGKVAETRKERVEDMRIRTLAMIFKEHRDVFDMLLDKSDWKRIEVYMGAKGLLRFRVLRDQAKELEDLKKLRRFRRKIWGR